MAEAVLNQRGQAHFVAESAGSRPAPQVNPYAVEALRDAGIGWQGHQPRGLEEVQQQPWDIVITVCDRAREACPFFPGQPIAAHWGMDDPAEVQGDEETKRRAFWHALQLITRRIDLLLALPIAKLERLALEKQVKAIGAEESSHSEQV
jgi:protein-tyrosine-phosphatase